MSALMFASRIRPISIKPQLGLYSGRHSYKTHTLNKRALKWSHHADRSSSPRLSLVLKLAGFTGAGIGLHAFTSPVVKCESPANTQTIPPPATPQGRSPPQSAVSIYELTFGSVCGMCAGVFIKKGAKAIAFVLGGVFVLLQYLGSTSMIRVDWAAASSRFENLFYRTEGDVRRAPTIGSLWKWLVDFLTADFQPRASFIAGLALGLRIG